MEKKIARWNELKAAITGRLSVEGATSLNDSELSRCFENCCAPEMLTRLSQFARDNGLFSFQDVPEYELQPA